LAEYTWVIDKRPAEALVRRGLLERQDYRGRRGKMRRYRVSNEARTLIEIINNDGKWPAAD
jgi:DNA-binding HxlR family transcriptional regulator